MLYHFTEVTVQDITDALGDVMLFLGHRDQMNAALHGDSKIKESPLTQIVAKALNSFGKEKRDRRIEESIENELQDPSQWDWDKAEKKPPVSSTYCPWTHNWDCDSPTKPCPEMWTVHEAHDWWSRTLRTTIQHCPGIGKKKELETLHCGAVVVHTKHSWSYRPKETLHCPGVEKKIVRPPEAQCPRVSRKEPHKAHSWEALLKIWWCAGIAKRHYTLDAYSTEYK